MKVALLINIIAPYRVPIYQKLGDEFSLFILNAGKENNRDTWVNIKEQLTNITVNKSWGFTLGYRKWKGGRVFENKYIHITPGYLFDLVRIDPDVIISSEMGIRTLIALTYGFFFRKPVWIWWGGTLHTERNIGKVKNLIRYIVSRWSTHWISYGETSTDYLLSLGVNKRRITQIQNCVDERMFSQPSEPALSLQPGPVFLFVGRLVGLKGVNLLLKAAGQLQREGRDFSLLLIGSGPEKDSLQGYARELGLRGVRFYPPQAPEKMPAFYRSADFLVFPTLSDVWGLVANEALLSGLPVLSSVYAGCTQEIIPEANRFDPLNEQDFLDAMRRALDGKIIGPDLCKLKTVDEVAQLIISDMKRVKI